MQRAILLEPEYAGNIGFIARLIENFGVDEYALVRPQCEIGETARQRASHAQETLKRARIVDGLSTVTDDLDVLIGTTGVRADEDNILRHGAPLRKCREHVRPDARTGILFGRESTGLSNAELDRCDMVATILTSEQYPVMNLSHAAAVVFYELSLVGEVEADEMSDVGGYASREQRAQLENLFKGMLDTLDWEERREERAFRAFRNLLGRAYLTDRERQILLGLFNDMQGDV